LEELESLKPNEEPEQPQKAPNSQLPNPLDASTYVIPEKEEPQESPWGKNKVIWPQIALFSNVSSQCNHLMSRGTLRVRTV